jgi:hypothetical protein
LGAFACLIARARAEPPLRLLILAAPDSEFVQRVRGQAADLPVEIEAAARAELPAPGELAALAQERQVQALAWLEPLPTSGYAVHFFSARNAQLLTRQTEGAGTSGQDPSALTEVAAMVVRSQLQELLQTAEPPPAAQEVVPAAAPTPAAQVNPPPSLGEVAAPGSARVQDSVEVHLGARAAWVSSSRVFFAPQLEAAWIGRHIAVGASLSASLPSRTSVHDARLRLREDRAGAIISHLSRLSSSLQLRAGLEAGIAVFSRETQAVSQGFQATPATRSPSALLAPRLDLRWAPRRFFALGITAGLDLLSAPPRYQVAYTSGRRQGERLGWAEPWLVLWLGGWVD